MKLINYKQIIVHFIASLMILFAIKNVYLFFNLELLSTVDKLGFQEVYNNSDKYEYSVEDFLWLSINQEIVIWIGILMAFLFSIFVSFKKKWSVWNSIIIFLILIVLNLFKLLNFPSYYISIGSLFSNWTIRIILNIIFFFIIGCYLFISERIISIISQMKNKPILLALIFIVFISYNSTNQEYTVLNGLQKFSMRINIY